MDDDPYNSCYYSEFYVDCYKDDVTNQGIHFCCLTFIS